MAEDNCIGLYRNFVRNFAEGMNIGPDMYIHVNHERLGSFSVLIVEWNPPRGQIYDITLAILERRKIAI